MISNQSKRYMLQLPAGQEAFLHPVSGRHFYVINSPVRLAVKLGEMAENDFYPGEGVSFDKGEEFGRIEIKKDIDAPIWIEIWVGFVAFVNQRKDTLESPVELVGWDGTEIPAASLVTFAPELTGARLRRKSFIVSNLDPAVSLEIMDEAGNVACIVRAGETITLHVSQVYQIGNATASAVPCRVGETYWTR